MANKYVGRDGVPVAGLGGVTDGIPVLPRIPSDGLTPKFKSGINDGSVVLPDIGVYRVSLRNHLPAATDRLGSA